MKKFFVVWCIVVALSVLMGITAVANAETYPTTFVVSEIDEYNDMIYLTDFCGNLWLATGIEDYEVGDIVAAIMDNNNTDATIYDDMIVAMRYTGYVEGWN